MPITTKDNFVCEVMPDSSVQLKTIKTVYEDDVLIGTSNSRKIIFPGDAYDSEPAIVQRVCAQVHVDTAVAAYNANKAVREAQANGEDTTQLEAQARAAEQAHEAWLNSNKP